ncbi:MAG: CGNR zinc finger domain-containing protein [Streptosporangiaceae bacterium]
MSYAGYDLNPLHLALDLASLGDGTLGLPQLLQRQRLMFTDHGYPAAIDAALEATLRSLGGELAAVLSHEPEDDFLDALAELLQAQPCQPYLTRHDGVPHLHYARDGAPLAEWLPAMAASGLVLYVCRHGRSRLRRCTAAGCGRWLVDTSRNQSRRYCEHACASRTTVAAYRARQKAAS